MASVPPFALFVLTKEKDIDSDYINWLNKSLERAWAGNFKAGWTFWLASTDAYTDIPRARDDGHIVPGTAPPLPESFTSAWSGKSIVDCGAWLEDIPSDINSALNRDLFAVVTDHSRDDDQFTSCQIYRYNNDNDGGKKSGIEVEYFPQDIDQVAMQFATNQGIKFYEKADAYSAVRKQRGLPDRSHILGLYGESG